MSTVEAVVVLVVAVGAFGALMYRVGWMAAINERERRIRCAREGKAP